MGAGFAGRPVTLSLLEIRAMALHSWIHMLYPPALRGPANQAVKRRREKNESLSERGPPGDFFCGSFFWSLKKMSHQGSRTPPPSP